MSLKFFVGLSLCAAVLSGACAEGLTLLDFASEKPKDGVPAVAVVEKEVESVKPVTNALAKSVAVAEAPAAKPAKKALTGRPAKISSGSTYYDRKHGFVVFDKRVYVDDEQYQLHADKAYVFLGVTNDLRRLVAIGHVAMTNDTKRAYGTKASYYRQNGMVVLYGDANRTAEVRDEAKVPHQSVTGSKIKFWIDSEQVEVLDATFTAPAIGADGVKDMLPGN